MNQEKIGKFIASRRELKKLKQTELADKLGVTNKAISKWENGRGMPDYSLFKDLCRELEISVTELLNGELDKKNHLPSEETLTSYIAYNEKKSKKKIKKLIIILILIIIFSILSIYFINTYKKITVYELSGESENFKYENGLLIKSNIKNILELGKITSNTIAQDQIINQKLTIKIKDQYYFITDIEESEVITENYGYGEYLNETKLKYIPDNLYIIIWYKIDDKISSEIIKLSYTTHIVNNKIIYRKQNSIDDGKLGEPININKYDNIKLCEQHYNNFGLEKENEVFIKELSANETIKFSCYTSTGDFVYKLETNNITIKSYGYRYNKEANYNTISFDIKDKTNNIRTSIIYDIKNDKIIKSKYSEKYKDYIIKAIKYYKKYNYQVTN